MNLIKYNFKIIKFFIQIQPLMNNRLFLLKNKKKQHFLQHYIQWAIKGMGLYFILTMFIQNKNQKYQMYYLK